MFYELVVRKVLLVTLYNKQTFLAAKIENKTPIKLNRMLNSERKTAFTASPLFTFTVAEFSKSRSRILNEGLGISASPGFYHSIPLLL